MMKSARLIVLFMLACLSVTANAACSGSAAWCGDGVQAKMTARDGAAMALVPQAATEAAIKGDFFVEGRIRAVPRSGGGKSQGYIIAGYADDRNWLGFGLEIVPGSDRLTLLIAQMVDGKLEYHKRVGRAVDAPGSFYTLRLDRADHALTLHVNGVRTIGIDQLKLPPGRVGTFAQGGDFEVDGLRVGDMRVAPVSIGLAHSGLQVNLQAGLSGLAGRTGRSARSFPVRVTSRDGMAAARFSAQSSDSAVVRVAIDNDKLVLTPLLGGQAAITVTSLDDANVGLTISAQVAPAFAHSIQRYVLQGRVEPAAQAKAVAIDSVLRLRLDGKPQLNKAGTVRIYRAADDVMVDEVYVGQEVNVIGAARDGFKRVVRYQPIQLDGNTLKVQLHDDRLAYGTDYYVAVDGNLLASAQIDGKPFSGIGKVAGWRFRTRDAKPAGSTITVDDDGPADFRTVQGALNHAMRHLTRAEPATIQIANGRYEELLYLRGKDNLTLRGASRDGVQIAYENNDGRNGGSGTGQPPLGPGAGGGRSVFLIDDADLLRMDTLTITNTTWNSKTIGGQAEAIHFNSEGRFVATHVNFISEQDTIQVKGYSWFYQCLIAGTVDFIWGNNHAALFEDSEIRSLGHSGGSERGGYVVQARTVAADDPGFVFLNSRLTHGPGPAGNDVLPGSIYLARPGVATAWDKVSYINNRMDQHIAAVGWNGAPRGGTGWTESGSMDLDGKAMNTEHRSGGRVVQGEATNRVKVFANFDNGRGWNPEVAQDDGRYRNPILHADYSDPDAIRVGDTYYMTASSFNSVPGLPLLTSKDMVNWSLVGHALPKLVPEAHFAQPRFGEGVWAPCLRYHDGKFWIFYPDPDFGIYVITAKRFDGPWSAPHLLIAGKGLIDPTPLWDNDGKAYLLHAWAKSRAGFNNVLTLHQMTPDGRKILDKQGKVVIDGNQLAGFKTLEGPKFYKHDGWYYVFAPAGGVEEGWQSVFRSRSIEGPYEQRIVMDQGASKINGPHQGAWVRAQDGKDWFMHFQDRHAYGRIVHLQPMQWNEGWPLIGEPGATAGRGQPVSSWLRPVPGQAFHAPVSSDEFDAIKLGMQWQWNANPGQQWISLTARPGWLRLYGLVVPAAQDFVRAAPNILTQKLPAPDFTVDTRIELAQAGEGSRAGLILNGMSYAWLGLRQQAGHTQLVHTTCTPAAARCQEKSTIVLADSPAAIYLRMQVKEGAQVQFYYSLDGKAFIPAGGLFSATKGRWVGAQMGLFNVAEQAGPGYLDIDYFRVRR
jgi:beta-xylosidase/pectin methylesterase-like acyl-CoA thioesterase